MFFIIPALLIAAINYFATVVTIVDDDGQPQTVTELSGKLILMLFVYVIVIICLGFGKHQSTRTEIITKLYEERCRERGEEVNPQELKLFLQRQNLDTSRAHCCWSCCYKHDYDFIDETGTIHYGRNLDDNDQRENDFCTYLWDCLSGMFWCCGCWCQCFGICALAQEEREVNRLTEDEVSNIDYLTMQPYSEYYPPIEQLRDNQIKSPWAHICAISELSSKLLKNVAAVLVVLLIFALSEVDETFNWENLVVLLMTLGQAFFIEYLVHWKWNLFDLSFDSVVKYFASGFFLATPMAVIFESIVSTVTGFVTLILQSIVIASDNELENELTTDPKKGMKDFAVNHPEVFILVQFVNAFCVAAFVEEIMKYFSYRMVVTPDTITSRSRSSLSSARSSKSTGSAVTVAMVSTALGFACCENLVYIFIYSPPLLDIQISTLLARSLFPVHPLCAAIQSIGVCKRDLERDKHYGLGRIIFPAFMLHGSFDFVLMLATYFQQVKNIKEGKDDDEIPSTSPDDGKADLASQLPSLICGLGLVITGYTFYIFQSRAQTGRLIAMDNALNDQISLLM